MDIATVFVLILLGIYFLYTGWSHRRSFDQSQAHVAAGHPTLAKKTIKYFTLLASVFVVIGAGEYDLIFVLIDEFGLAGLCFLLGLSIAVILILLIVTKKTRDLTYASGRWPIRADGFLNFTTPDYLFARFSRRCSLIATIITVIAFAGILEGQFVIGGTLISAVSGLPYEVAIALMAVVVAGYCIIGGFSAMFFTDQHQGILMWIALIVVMIFIFITHGVSPESLQKVVTLSASSFSWDYPIALIILVLTVPAAFSGPDLWQRIHMAESESDLQKGLILAAAAFLIFGTIIVFIYLNISSVKSLAPELFAEGQGILRPYINIVTGHVDKESLLPYVWPKWLQIVFAVGLLSAFVSTADTSAMLIASAVQNETRRNAIRNFEASILTPLQSIDHAKRPELIEIPHSTRAIIVAFSIGATAIASVYFQDVAAIFVGVLGALAVMGLPVFWSFDPKFSEAATFWALSVGLLIFFGQVIFTTTGLIDGRYNDGYYLLLPLVPGLTLGVQKLGLRWG